MGFEKAYAFIARGVLDLLKNERGFKDFDAVYDAAENGNLKDLAKDLSTLVVTRLMAEIDNVKEKTSEGQGSCCELPNCHANSRVGSVFNR
eukprot:1349655-Heterocapsa_arctica.AAC.1